jgi:hypothetical protein
MATRAVAKTPTGIPTSHSSNTLHSGACAARRGWRREARGPGRAGKGRAGIVLEPRRSGVREPRSRGRLDYMDISTTRWGAGALEKKPKGRADARWDTRTDYIQLIYTVSTDSCATCHRYRDRTLHGDVVRASGAVERDGPFYGGRAARPWPDVMNPNRPRAFTSTGAEVEKAEDRHVHW